MPAENGGRPRLKAPAGTCDTHMHIYDRRYPPAPTAKLNPPDAPVASYLKVRERLGIERTVVVQPSTYGTDNRCTLEAMAALGESARGIAVVDHNASDAELERLTKAGVRGIRFFMLPGGALSWDILESCPGGWPNSAGTFSSSSTARSYPHANP
jgi:D-galactarolactone isomerase